VSQIEELVRQGVSQAKIAKPTGFDCKTVRKYSKQADSVPRYGPRKPRPSKLDRLKPFIEERLRAGVWNAVVLLRELREHGYHGGYTILKDYLQPLREVARTVAVRRFETPAGKQAQVDWGHLGEIEANGKRRPVWGFVFTLGHSRAMNGRSGARPEAANAVAGARRGLPAARRYTEGDSLRPHEDGLGGDRRVAAS
jgi:transposase